MPFSPAAALNVISLLLDGCPESYQMEHYLAARLYIGAWMPRNASEGETWGRGIVIFR